MKKAVITILVVVVLAVGAFALASSNKTDDTMPNDSMSSMDTQNQNEQTQSETKTAAVAQDTVEINNYAYNPANITVKVGTKVTWTNKDSVKHDVTSDDGIVNGPESELLAKGESYSFTFAKAGSYTYHCSPHPYMKGTVTVTE